MDARYWANAVSAFVRHAREREFLMRVARSGLDADTQPRAETVFMLDRYPEITNLTIDTGPFSYGRSNQDPMERFFLAVLCRLAQPKRIFEIGTFDGSTTRLLAAQAPDAEVFTIDLPADDAKKATVVEEAAHTAAGSVGKRFRDQPEATRIEQLLGDSRTFDFSPWFHSIDLVVVDGGHTYDCAFADTRSALQMLAPGGVIVWDDYVPGWPDVVRAVDETRLPVIHVARTGLAVYDTRGEGGPIVDDG